MKSKLLDIDANGRRTFVVVFETGEEAVAALEDFVFVHGIDGAQVSAIGALERGVVAWLNWETKTYEPIPVEEQCEVVSILGDVAKSECGAPSLHLHGVLGFRGGATVGGHVRELHVRPTLEVIVTETPEHLRRRPRPDLGGIALIELKDGA